MRSIAIILTLLLNNRLDAQIKLIPVPGQNFAMEEHEVTISQFLKFIETTGYKTDAEKIGKGKCYSKASGKIILKSNVNFRFDLYGEPITQEDWTKLPVVHVSYNDALAYAKWLGKDYDIPEYQQWYLAATAGIKNYKYRYPGSNNGKEIGWFDNNSGQQVKYIKLKKPNEIGLYDIGGNVCEIIKPDNTGKYKGKFRGVGGSYFNGEDMMDLLLYKKGTNSGWVFENLNQTYPYMGFRCIKYIRK